MRIVATPLAGVHTIEREPISDDRGWFARTFDAAGFADAGLDLQVQQANASFNARRGTLRGMHLQRAPHGEPKLVTCVRGAVWDVALDLRPDSPSFRAWHGVELGAAGGVGYFLPEGVAHGFLTLTDDAEVHYLMGHHFVPDAAAGVRWDDPAFGIDWPDLGIELTISAKDRAYADYTG